MILFLTAAKNISLKHAGIFEFTKYSPSLEFARMVAGYVEPFRKKTDP